MALVVDIFQVWSNSTSHSEGLCVCDVFYACSADKFYRRPSTNEFLFEKPLCNFFLWSRRRPWYFRSVWEVQFCETKTRIKFWASWCRGQIAEMKSSRGRDKKTKLEHYGTQSFFICITGVWIQCFTWLCRIMRFGGHCPFWNWIPVTDVRGKKCLACEILFWLVDISSAAGKWLTVWNSERCN